MNTDPAAIPATDAEADGHAAKWRGVGPADEGDTDGHVIRSGR